VSAGVLTPTPSYLQMLVPPNHTFVYILHIFYRHVVVFSKSKDLLRCVSWCAHTNAFVPPNARAP